MAFSLDDLIAAPTDPDLLNQHLQGLGLLKRPEEPPPAIAPAQVGQLSAVTSPSTVATMTPPTTGMDLLRRPAGTAPSIEGTPPIVPRTAARPADLTSEISGVPGGMEAGGTATPPIVAPMTPPRAPTLKESQAAGGDRKEDIEAAKEIYRRERPQVTAEPGTEEYERQKLIQNVWDGKHGWGADISAHPGMLGKIGHVAGLIGQIAGGAIVPHIMPTIPGTIQNRIAQEQGEFGRIQELGKAASEAAKAKSEIAARDIATAEGRERLKKLQTEQSLEKDSEGNVTGWKGPDGQIHSLENAPQEIKDVAAATQNKPHFEKTDNGDIVQITPGKGGAAATSNVVYKGNPKQKTEIRAIVDPATGKAHDHIFDVTPGSPTFGQSLKDLGRSKEDRPESPTAAITKQKAGERVVLAYDKDGKAHLMSRNDAEEEGMQHITAASTGDIDKAKTHHTVLNTLQTQLNTVVDKSKALDQGWFQRGIIARALAHPGNTTYDSVQRGLALSQATEQTRDYVQAVLALREASLGLPKEITGGSRVSEIQASALWATAPGAEAPDSKYAIKQSKKFQQDIDRLRERAPEVRGLTITDPDDAIKTKKGEEKQRTVGGETEKYTVGQIVKGYKFKGGDWKKKENWEKQAIP